jgi:SAM-dependent methyltransferase
MNYEEMSRYAMKIKVRMNSAAQCWNLNNKDHVVGSFDAHNKHGDYDTYIFDPIYNHCFKSDEMHRRIFEFGCGVGRNIEHLYNDDFRDNEIISYVDGADISSVCLEKADEWLHHNGVPMDYYNLKEINGYDLNNFNSDTYNAVYSTIAMQHIPRHDVRLSLFKEFYRILNDTGMIAIQMGFGPGKKLSVGYYENIVTEDVRDTRIEGTDELRADIEKVGFKNFEYDIRPVGPGDGHPNWIFFRAWK